MLSKTKSSIKTKINVFINCKQVLPQNYNIPESGQHLLIYKIGLTHIRVGDDGQEPKQHLFYRIFVVIIMSYFSRIA
jgi:hypothetical protein